MFTEKDARPWQRRFFEMYGRHADPNCLKVALPAAGKTKASLWAMREWRNGAGAKPRLIVYVAPLKHLKGSFKKTAYREFGLQFQTSEFDGTLKPGMHGLCLTYAGMAAAAHYIRGLSTRYDVAVVFDEPHLMSEDATWGKAALIAFEHATKRLFMTGTPWRKDMVSMPFLGAKRDADGVYVPDFLFDWPLALEEEPPCVRILNFRYFHDTVEYEDAETHEIVSLDSRETLTKEQQDRWLVGAIRSDEMITAMIEEAHKRLLKVREAKPDAAGIIVCEDQNRVEAVARKLRRITGVTPHLVISDDERADGDVDDFEREGGIWCVSVRKVSEGIDIPRLMVGVYLTNWRTELFFRQFVGRVARNQGTSADSEAYVFMPHHWLLMEYATKIESLQAVALRERQRRNGAGTGSGPSRVNYIGDRDAELGGILQPNSRSASRDVRTIEAFADEFRGFGMTETLAAHLLQRGYGPARAAADPPPRATADDWPLEDQLRSLRKLINIKARRLAFASGAEADPEMFRKVQRWANEQVGCASVEQASLEQLRKMSALLDDKEREVREARDAQPEG
jgi:superfamily II DNA or RNA helicase